MFLCSVQEYNKHVGKSFLLWELLAHLQQYVLCKELIVAKAKVFETKGEINSLE